MGEVEAAESLAPSTPPAALGTPGRARGAGGAGRRWSHSRRQIQPSWGIRPHLARFTPEKQRRLPAPLSGTPGPLPSCPCQRFPRPHTLLLLHSLLHHVYPECVRHLTLAPGVSSVKPDTRRWAEGDFWTDWWTGATGRWPSMDRGLESLSGCLLGGPVPVIGILKGEFRFEVDNGLHPSGFALSWKSWGAIEELSPPTEAVIQGRCCSVPCPAQPCLAALEGMLWEAGPRAGRRHPQMPGFRQPWLPVLSVESRAHVLEGGSGRPSACLGPSACSPSPLAPPPTSPGRVWAETQWGEGLVGAGGGGWGRALLGSPGGLFGAESLQPAGACCSPPCWLHPFFPFFTFF
ncbi:uncharacterized protein LOC122420250 [Cervus canadensis]|uniref:uncharacterized protein LOC122420250 n=1 Tax=Cervus canadensis TaxID=1574408 RepID=UPI001CA3647E|nr:uncharacterized protein LOC122420250 [Cervus canadensis]